MMTQPIQTFEESDQRNCAGGGKRLPRSALSYEDRRLLELRARYARAELMADILDRRRPVARPADAARLVAGIKADFKLRAAEAQLFRMSDRELADIGLCRADIPFAVREAARGVAPEIDARRRRRSPRPTRSWPAA